MKIGIVGGPGAGKTTLFKLLTEGNSTASSLGVMEIKDPRISWLSSVYKPKRTTYARVDIEDIRYYKGRELLNAIRDLDAVIVVVGTFFQADPMGILNELETESFVADLVSVEGRLERLSSNKAKPLSPMEVPFLKKCKSFLDDYIPLRSVTFESHEEPFAANFSFFTKKPIIVAKNVSEDELLDRKEDEIDLRCKENGYTVVTFSGAVEEEIAGLPEEEGMSFLREYGFNEPGAARIAQASYDHLGLISFFTVGEDEVRAWTVNKGVDAREAAGKIHTDLEKGFIRAEVVSYEDFRKLGSMKACKEEGLLRVEGRTYIVQDGDILNIRFNV